MKIKFEVIILLCTFLQSCVSVSQKKDTQEVLYVIPHHQTKTFAHKVNQDFSILFFYGQHNFILTNNKIFYHPKHIFFKSSEKVNFTLPPQLFLLPNDFSEIAMPDLQSFLNKNVLDTAAQGRSVYVSIVSPSDTIKNQSFNTLNDFFQSKKNLNYIIRNWTEEEQLSLSAKIFKKPYNPDTVQWKIGFGYSRKIKSIAK